MSDRIYIEQALAALTPQDARGVKLPAKVGTAIDLLCDALASEGGEGRCKTCGSDDPEFAFDPIRPEQPRRPIIWHSSDGSENWRCPDPFHVQPGSEEGEDWPEVITAARLWLQEEHGSRRPMADADEAARRLYDALAAIPAPEGSDRG